MVYMSRADLASLPAVALLILACGGDHSAAPDESDLDHLPLLTYSEEQRIGDRDDPELGFTRVTGVDVNEEGDVYILDASELQIRVFDQNGRMLRSMGTRGRGPGEFMLAPTFGVFSDTVWAAEGGGAPRLTLFSPTGDVIRTSQIEAVRVPIVGPRSTVLLPRFRLPDGTFSTWTSTVSAGGDIPDSGIQPGDTIAVPRVRYDGRGTLLDTVGWHSTVTPRRSDPQIVNVQAHRYRIPEPPSDELLSIPLGDGSFLVDRTAGSGIIRVVKLAFSGDTTCDRQYSYNPQGYGSAALDMFAEGASRRRVTQVMGTNVGYMPTEPDAETRQAAQVIKQHLNYPSYQPPIQDYWTAKDGTIWLRREELGEETFRWVILGPDCSARGQVSLPRNTRLMWNHGDTFWAVEVDEVGVPWVVKYRLTDAPPP